MSHFSPSTALLALDAVALDCETTGLDARIARVVQIGAVRIVGSAPVPSSTLDILVNPGSAIPKTSTAVHGITDAMVAAAPAFPAVAPELEAFVGHSVLLGHTIAYDLKVLEREYALSGRRWPGFRALDVAMLARLANPTLADYGLERLCSWLGIELKGRHTALGDAAAAADVFFALVPLLRERGVRTLAEAEAAGRDLAERDGRVLGGPPIPSLMPASQTAALERIDSFPYRHRVRDVMTAPPAFASPETTVGGAVGIIIEKRISSVFVRAAPGEFGIVTERDLLRALDERGDAALTAPIGDFMKTPLQTVHEDDFLYRAIGRIEHLGFRHLGVSNGQGEIVGAVTTRNLLRHRAATALKLGDEIATASTAAELAAAWSKLPTLAHSLTDEGVDPRLISAVVSSEICSMTRRAAQLAEARLADEGAGPPPVPFAVMVLGSAGRGESQLAADQDNAIVYAEGAEGGSEDAYFQKLAAHMNDILDAAGLVLCKGGVMARNREWRKSVGDWRETIDGWIRRQRPADLLNVDIFFDLVPVYGDYALAETIWNHAYARGHAAPDFQNLLIENARRRSTPFTLLGALRLDEKNRVDLKKSGLMPIFGSARVLSIRHDVRARSTADRLNGVASKGIGSPETVAAILDAQRELLGAVMMQQVEDAKAGVPLSPRVDPKLFGKSGKAKLRRALSVVDEAIGLASEGRI
jgi:DNA polymerase-3 subunit epsilon/CBS domain-containing protein